MLIRCTQTIVFPLQWLIRENQYYIVFPQSDPSVFQKKNKTKIRSPVIDLERVSVSDTIFSFCFWSELKQIRHIIIIVDRGSVCVLLPNTAHTLCLSPTKNPTINLYLTHHSNLRSPFSLPQTNSCSSLFALAWVILSWVVVVARIQTTPTPILYTIHQHHHNPFYSQSPQSKNTIPPITPRNLSQTSNTTTSLTTKALVPSRTSLSSSSSSSSSSPPSPSASSPSSTETPTTPPSPPSPTTPTPPPASNAPFHPIGPGPNSIPSLQPLSLRI